MRVEICFDVKTPRDLDEAATKLHRAADELERAASEARHALTRRLNWTKPPKGASNV